MDKTEARRLRSELQTLTQASFTVSTFLHIKQGFVASNQKTREGAGGGTPSTTTSPPPPPPLPNPPALQICKCVAEQKERVYGKADFHGVRSVPHAGSWSHHCAPSSAFWTSASCCVCCLEEQDTRNGTVGLYRFIRHKAVFIKLLYTADRLWRLLNLKSTHAQNSPDNNLRFVKKQINTKVTAIK